MQDLYFIQIFSAFFSISKRRVAGMMFSRFVFHFLLLLMVVSIATGWRLHTLPIPVSMAKPVSLASRTDSISRIPRVTTRLTSALASTDVERQSQDLKKQRNIRGMSCILGGALAHLTLGTLYCWGNFLSYAPDKLKFFDGQPHPGQQPDALYVIPLNFAVQALLMPFSPLVVKALGASRTLLLGSWIVALSVYMASFQTSLTMFLALYSILFGAGVGLAYTAPMAAGWKWLPERKGLVSGGILSGFGAGGFVFSLIGSKLVNPLGLNTVEGKFPPAVYDNFPRMLRTLALLYALISGFGSLLVSEPKTPATDSQSSESTIGPGLSAKQALSSSQFWLMWIMIVCSATAGLNTVAAYKQYASSYVLLNHDRFLSLVGGIAALFNGSGRLLWGIISDKIGFKASYRTVTLLQALLLVTFPFSTTSKVLSTLNMLRVVELTLTFIASFSSRRILACFSSAWRAILL